MLVRQPFLALDRLEAGEVHHAARRVEVVQDRLVAGEPLEPHHLLGEERAVVAKLDVALPRNVAEALVERHGGSLLQGQRGEPAPDGRRELEAVARAGRADDDAAAPLEHERLVGGRRVEARLRRRPATGSTPASRSPTHSEMRATISGSGAPSASGSAAAPEPCAPAFSPCTGSWSAYIACPPVSGLRSTIAGGGGPSRRKYANVSRVARTGRPGTSCAAQGPAVTTTTSASTSSSDSTRVPRLDARPARRSRRRGTRGAPGRRGRSPPRAGTAPTTRAAARHRAHALPPRRGPGTRRRTRRAPPRTSPRCRGRARRARTSPSSSCPDSASSSRQPVIASPARRTQCASGYASRTMRVRPWLEPRAWSRSNCSSTVTSAPRSVSAHAAAQPITPAPTTATRVTRRRCSGAAERVGRSSSSTTSPARTGSCGDRGRGRDHVAREQARVPRGVRDERFPVDEVAARARRGGVSTTGPSEIAKSCAFAPARPGANQSFMSV